jgi:hypothetical protein
MDAPIIASHDGVSINYGAMDEGFSFPFQEFTPEQVRFIHKHFSCCQSLYRADKEYLQKIENRQLTHIANDISFVRQRMADAEERGCCQKSMSLFLIALTVALVALTCFMGGYVHLTGDMDIKYAFAIPPIVYLLFAIVAMSYFEHVETTDNYGQEQSKHPCPTLRFLMLIPIASCYIPVIANGREERLQARLADLEDEWSHHSTDAAKFFGNMSTALLEDLLHAAAQLLTTDKLQQKIPQRSMPSIMLPSSDVEACADHLKTLNEEELSAILYACRPLFSKIYHTIVTYKRHEKSLLKIS